MVTLQTLLVLLPWLCVVAEGAISPNCNHCDCSSSDNNNTDDLRFVDPYPLQPLRWEIEFCHCLCCCTNRPSDVTHGAWYKWESGNWTVKKDWAMHANGQCLENQVTRYMDDKGTYLCTATDQDGSVINRTFSVIVQDCTSDVTIQVQYREPGVMEINTGSDVTLSCQGDFGCLGADASKGQKNLVWWSVDDQTVYMNNLTSTIDQRYTFKSTVSDDLTKKGIDLTIHGLESSDYHRHFLCFLKKGTQPTVTLHFTISPIETKDVITPYLGLIIGLPVGVVVVVFLVTAVVTYKCRHVITLSYRTWRNTLPQRGTQHDFDVMLVFRDDESNDVIEEMKRELEARNFKLLPDSPLGTQDIKPLNDAAKCVTVIFVITEFPQQDDQTYDQRISLLTGRVGVCSEYNTNMVFVSWSEVDWKRMLRDYPKFSENIPKLCPVAYWPSDTAFARKIRRRHFWAHVQCALPKPRPQAEQPREETRPMLA